MIDLLIEFFCTLQTSAASASPYILVLFVIVFGGQLADCLRKYFLSTGAVRKIFNTLGKVHFVSQIRFIKQQQQQALFPLGLTEVLFQGYILTITMLLTEFLLLFQGLKRPRLFCF